MRTVLLLLFLMGIEFFASSCGTLVLNYTPSFEPITFIIQTNGNILVQGNTSIVTEVGTFPAERNISDTLQPENNALLLIIRHLENGAVVDTVYKISKQQQLSIVVDGGTAIQITSNPFSIDASKGNIKSIEVKGA